MTAPDGNATKLHVLCAGAAKGLVLALQQAFTADMQLELDASFGAVGAMKEKLVGGTPCDVVILSAALIDDLVQSGHVLRESVAALGRVRTGVAVRAGEPFPDIASRTALRESLRATDGIFLPDPLRATAGMHFVQVLRSLGIYEELGTRLHSYPNGATAMRELAQTRGPHLIGCTQITEINYTPGVALAGPLTGEFELATVYTAAVCTASRQADAARRLTGLLAGPDARAIRAQGGFESAQSDAESTARGQQH